MDKYVLPENHFCFTINKDIDKICRPLFERTDVTYFAFSRYYRDGASIALMSNPVFLKNLDSVCSAGIDDPGAFAREGSCLQDEVSGVLMPESVFGHISQSFFLDHHYYIFEKYDDQFCFATTPENQQIKEFYLYNQDVMERFVLYFLDKAENIIKLATEHKTHIPFPDKALLNPLSVFNREAFFSEIARKRYCLTTEKTQHFLSKQKFLVLHHLLKAKTVKQVANELGLPPRTVELYLNNIKHKLNCYSKSQVMDLFLKSKLSKQVDEGLVK